MKVLLCHNYYQQAGGEDRVFLDETELLRNNGHTVEHFTMHNDDVGSIGKLSAAMKTFYNRASAKKLRKQIRRFRPDVMHCTNTFPLISPAAYYTAKKEGVAVVQALHNYRLLCPSPYLMRDHKVCELCIKKRFKWQAVRHACYRESRSGSMVLASMLAFHRILGTWTKTVDLYYALTEFGRKKFIEGGLPSDRILVKPNFVDPVPVEGTGSGAYVVFVGRLSPEKGISTLLDAWQILSKHENCPQLKIIGDGPLAEQVKQAATDNDTIEWLGWQEHNEVQQLVGNAACLVQPSLWYEGFPKTIAEAFALGTPVIGSQLGAMEEIISHEETGWLFTPGSANALSEIVNDVFSLQDDEWSDIRKKVREEFMLKYTAEVNYQHLIAIYDQAILLKSGAMPSRVQGKNQEKASTKLSKLRSTQKEPQQTETEPLSTSKR